MYKCKTKYPVFLVHGMGFRDSRIFGYWGRIPRILKENGAKVYFGSQDANGSIESNAAMLDFSLQKVLSEAKTDKVNIIAHSKGGLEARYLISSLGREDNIASLTTISTPHHGSQAVDKLLKIPKPLVWTAAKLTDAVKRVCGDKHPDTYRCFYQLTTEFAAKFNADNPDSDKIYYQSCGFEMKTVFSDIFMIIPYIGVKLLDGRSDGLLTEKSVTWTNYLGTFTGTGRRGISHCDETDMRRRPLRRTAPTSSSEISDITEFYTELVSGLKEKGF